MVCIGCAWKLGWVLYGFDPSSIGCRFWTAFEVEGHEIGGLRVQ